MLLRCQEGMGSRRIGTPKRLVRWRLLNRQITIEKNMVIDLLIGHLATVDRQLFHQINTRDYKIVSHRLRTKVPLPWRPFSIRNMPVLFHPRPETESLDGLCCSNKVFVYFKLLCVFGRFPLEYLFKLKQSRLTHETYKTYV